MSVQPAYVRTNVYAEGLNGPRSSPARNKRGHLGTHPVCLLFLAWRPANQAGLPSNPYSLSLHPRRAPGYVTNILWRSHQADTQIVFFVRLPHAPNTIKLEPPSCPLIYSVSTVVIRPQNMQLIFKLPTIRKLSEIRSLECKTDIQNRWPVRGYWRKAEKKT